MTSLPIFRNEAHILDLFKTGGRTKPDHSILTGVSCNRLEAHHLEMSSIHSCKQLIDVPTSTIFILAISCVVSVEMETKTMTINMTRQVFSVGSEFLQTENRTLRHGAVDQGCPYRFVPSRKVCLRLVRYESN